jgi:hypothetical protein
VAKTWILDTGTKGTGASVRPLERAQEPRKPSGDKLSAPRKPRPKPRPEPKARPPRQFKIIDVVTRATLAEHVDTRSALRVLQGVRSTVDVHVYAYDPDGGDWRLLSLKEQRALWDARHRVPDGSL